MSQSDSDYAIDELISICIARQVQDGDVWAQGINTPLVMAGLLLAKLTHAPSVRFVSAIGQGVVEKAGPMRLQTVERNWLDGALMSVGFAQGTAELLPAYRPKEFFRPAQIDSQGNTNNIAFGTDYTRPRMRLPGVGGIPDVTPQYDDVHLYVPRHLRVTFCEKVDYISGVGHSPERTQGSGPRYLVTDMGQFDWHEGRMRLMSWHPGTSVEAIQKRTGFALQIAENAAETTPPTPEEIHLLRTEIDPLGIRKLETLGGRARRDHLRWIVDHEDTTTGYS